MDNLFANILKVGKSFHMRKKIIDPYSPQDLIRKVKRNLPINSTSLKRVIKEFETEYLPFCVNQANPRYLAFPDCGNFQEAVAADVLKTLLNQNLIADVKSAPIGTYMEIQIIDWFRKLVGYKSNSSFPKGIEEVGGVVTFGGVMSIVTSLLVARSKLKKECFRKGYLESKTYLLVPDVINHYSTELSLGYLGIGTDNLVRIKLNPDYGMNLEDLRQTIKKIKLFGGKILSVVAYAGDSRTMKIDNLREISKICRKENIWLHVDACHGGALLFSNRLRKKLNGIEFADSVTLDPHKTLGVPYPCSLVLFKRSQDLMHISRNHDLVIEKGTYDLGQITPFIGSKSFESLKLWFLLTSQGKKKIGREVERRYQMAKYFKQRLDKDSNFITLNDVNINSVCFIYFPKELKNLLKVSKEKKDILDFIDQLNKNIHNTLYQGGELCVHTFKLLDAGNRANLRDYGKRQCLGVIMGNPQTNKSNLKSSYDILKREADKVYQEMRKSLK